MEFGLNTHPYDIDRARKESDYGRYFTNGWTVKTTKDSREFERLITTHVWSPIVFSSSHRISANFLRSRLLVLDFDKPDYSLAQCVKEWCDTIHWIGTSRNHMRDKHGITCERFRLIVAYDRDITSAREYSFNLARLLDLYAADQVAKDPARLFFPCQEIVSVNLDGYYQPVVDAPPEEIKPPRDYSAYRAHRMMPRWVEGVLKFGAAEGTRNTTCFKIAVHLTRCGFPYNEIIDLIMASPIPVGKHVQNEVEKSVASGIKRGLKEIENEQKEDPIGSDRVESL